jgi:hypothetical protein
LKKSFRRHREIFSASLVLSFKKDVGDLINPINLGQAWRLGRDALPSSADEHAQTLLLSSALYGARERSPSPPLLPR